MNAKTGSQNAAIALKINAEGCANLADDCRARLAAYLRRMVSSDDDICDIIQEAYLRLCGLARKLDKDAAEPFLFTVARNVAISRMRRAETVERNQTSFELFERQRHDQRTVEQNLIRSQEREAVLRAINTLPPKCKEVFILRMIHGLDHRTIGKRLDIATSTVEKHIAKGIQGCRTHLRQEQTTAVDAGRIQSRRKSGSCSAK